MSDIPVHCHPHVRAGTQAQVSSDAHHCHIAAAAALADAGDSIILIMQPGDDRSDEPFARTVLSFVGTIGDPESRFEIAAQASSLNSLRADEGMEILVGYEAPDIEQAGIGPVRAEKQVG